MSSSLHLAMVVLDDSAWPVIYVVRADELCCNKGSPDHFEKVNGVANYLPKQKVILRSDK